LFFVEMLQSNPFRNEDKKPLLRSKGVHWLTRLGHASVPAIAKKQAA